MTKIFKNDLMGENTPIQGKVQEFYIENYYVHTFLSRQKISKTILEKAFS